MERDRSASERHEDLREADAAEERRGKWHPGTAEEESLGRAALGAIVGEIAGGAVGGPPGAIAGGVAGAAIGAAGTAEGPEDAAHDTKRHDDPTADGDRRESAHPKGRP